jgi:hypothetical protein
LVALVFEFLDQQVKFGRILGQVAAQRALL